MLLVTPQMCHSRPLAASARIMFFFERRGFSRAARQSLRFVVIQPMRSEVDHVACLRFRDAGTPSRWYCCRIAYYWPRLRLCNGDKRRRLAAGGDNRWIGNCVLAAARAFSWHGPYTDPRNLRAVVTLKGICARLLDEPISRLTFRSYSLSQRRSREGRRRLGWRRRRRTCRPGAPSPAGSRSAAGSFA